MTDKHKESFFSKRTVLGMLFIVIGISFCLSVTMLTVYSKCIQNYYEYMPIYPGAENIAEQSSLANYFGFGELSSTWSVELDASTVDIWYRVHVGTIKDEYANNSIENIQSKWLGHYEVIGTATGSEIILRSGCF